MDNFANFSEDLFRKFSRHLPDLIFQFTRRPDGSFFVPIASKGIENILKLEISNKYNDIFSPDNFYCKNLCSFYTQCLDRYGVYD